VIARGGCGRVLAVLGLDRNDAVEAVPPGPRGGRLVRESKIMARLRDAAIPPFRWLE